jgi:Ca-activated chloride channel family protein
VDKPIPNDPVAGLIDIPLPAQISLWPETWTLRMAIVLIVGGMIAAIWWFARQWRTNRYRRAALAELDRILHAPQPSAVALELLLRRTALAVFPRDTVAPLNGQAWLAFLDKTYGGHEFSEGAGRMLALSPYERQPADTGNITSTADLVRRWIRTHHA